MCGDMLTFHLLSSVAYVKHIYMIEHGNKTGGQIYQKHKFKKNEQTNRQTIRKNRQTSNYQMRIVVSVHCCQNHDQGSRIDCINSFCMHNSGL